MTHITRVFALVLVTMFACTLGLAACAPANGAVLASAPEPTPTATATPTVMPSSKPSPTPTPVPTPSPSPLAPESLTYKQKADMIGSLGGWEFPINPSRIYIFYLKSKDQDRLVWVKKESYPPGNGFDLLDVFNDEILFHVSIEPKDQGKVTPSDFPKYVDSMNESLSQYSIVAAGKLLDINDLYTNNKIDFTGTGKPYDALSPYLKKNQSNFLDWSKKDMLDPFIDVTPAQYILPIWEYVPNAVTPSSYFNPPSPTPILTPTPTVSPIPDSYKNQVLPLLGIDQDFGESLLVGNIEVFYYSLNGSKRIIWATSYYGTPEGTHDLHSIFNDEYLFSWYYSIPGYDKASIFLFDAWKYHSASSPMLDGIQLLGSGSIMDIIYNYENWGIDYPGNDLLDKIQYDQRYDWDAFDADMYIPLTKDEIIDLYMRLTPLEYIPPFWEYVPNAVTPDGFFTPVPESSPTTGP